MEVKLNEAFEMCKTALAVDLRESIDSFLVRSARQVMEHPGSPLACDNLIMSLKNVTNMSHMFRNLIENTTLLMSQSTQLDKVATTRQDRENANDSSFSSGNQTGLSDFGEYEPLLDDTGNDDGDDAGKDDSISLSSLDICDRRKDLSNYTAGDRLAAFLTYISDLDGLRFSVVNSQSSDIHRIFELSKMVHLPQYEKLPPDDDVFGVLLDNLIWRAVLQTKETKNKEQKASIFLLELGEVVQLEENALIYKLPYEYQCIPAQAILCQLQCENPEKVNHLRELLQESLFTKRDFEIVEKTDKVLLLTPTDVEAQQVFETANDGLFETSNYGVFDGDDLEDVFFDEYETSGNPMKLVTGYEPQDDKRLCPFYDPKIDGCFKGGHCKMEHTAPQRDGLTKDIILGDSLVDNYPDIVYSCESRINITVTYVISLASFYAHINDPLHAAEPNLWLDEDLSTRQRITKPPQVFDIVLAKYTDGIWYRAKVMELDGAQRVCKVFYIDYGNSHTVHVRDVAQCDYEIARLPAQAVLCRIASIVDSKQLDRKSRTSALDMLSEIILNRTFDVKVVSHYEDLNVEFLEGKESQIPAKMLALGLVEERN